MLVRTKLSTPLRARANGRNIVGQQLPTLLDGILFHVVESCCAKFETGQTFSSVQTDATLMAKNPSHYWELLRPFARSVKTRTSDSSLHSISTATINILDRAGSRGNSTIWRPRGVRLPVLSKAPRIHSWYMEFKILSCKVTNEKQSHRRAMLTASLSGT